MNVAIRVQGVTKAFGSCVAVDRLDMTIPCQTVYGFLGPNGSGKTTAIRMMCGLLTPSGGEIEVLGLKIPEHTRQVRRQVGYMTQKFSLYSDLSVLQNMQFMGRIMGVGRGERGNRIMELLERFHLMDIRQRQAGDLSGGQKRRLALAAAIIHKPQLLLLDEPTSEVDPNTRRAFWDELFIMCETGTTVLVTTHLMDEAERCHHLAILNEGRKVADGTPAELRAGLGATVFRLEGQDITPAVATLKARSGVYATTRTGNALRVLLRQGPEQGRKWLDSQLSGYALTIHPDQPTIEDVFVMATRCNGTGG